MRHTGPDPRVPVWMDFVVPSRAGSGERSVGTSRLGRRRIPTLASRRPIRGSRLGSLVEQAILEYRGRTWMGGASRTEPCSSRSVYAMGSR